MRLLLSRLAGLILLVLVALHSVAAQEKPAPAPPAQAPAAHHAQGETSKGESGKEAKQAEDESAAFKQSPSVKFLARKIGLSPGNAYWLAVILNFAVIAGILFWLSRAHLPGMFRDRTAAIQKSMEEARQASEQANRRLAEIESRLSSLNLEIGEMRAVADREAAAEEDRIKAAAAQDTRKIVVSAEQEIAAAAKAARRELTAYAANLAVSMAQKQIHVDAPTDQALVRSFADQLSSAADGKPGKDGR